jgi:predicted nucleic acid-binding protein
MSTAVDTNIIVALWDRDVSLSSAVQAALDKAANFGSIIVSAPVFSELLAAPGRDEEFIDRFVAETGVIVDWDFDQNIWRAAGRAYRLYALRRRRHRETDPRRILADFLIGAHASELGYQLLTLDARFYRAAFPKLEIVTV